MHWIAHHPKSMLSTAIVVVVIAFFGLDSQGKNVESQGYLDLLTGSLPAKVCLSLESLHQEINESNQILRASQSEVLILTRDNELRHVAYYGNALWIDGKVVLKSVDRFHFEFRDGQGNLMTRADSRLDDIDIVTYIVKMTHRSDSVLGSARIPVKTAASVQFAAL